MRNSLSWIEWLDRLDRVLESVRGDLKSLKRLGIAGSIPTLALGQRQLAALANELRLLDHSVLAPQAPGSHDRGANLQRALDTTVFQLGKINQVPATLPFVACERLIAAVDSALHDSAHAAALLLAPSQRRA